MSATMTPRHTTMTIRRARGFTLLEVLITVVIFSVGLLGIAGLQMTGMKQTHNAHLRAVATMQAQDMADRMRANSAGVTGGLYDTMPTSCSADCAANQCTSAEMAEYDMCEWKDAIEGTTGVPALLPGAVAILCLDSSPAPDDPDTTDWGTDDECTGTGNVYAVKLQWDERAIDDRDDIADQSAGGTLRRYFYMRIRP